jgi:rhodanese-related sulfurtransferase
VSSLQYQRQNNMMNTLKNLFGMGPTVDFSELIKQGAIVLDVRSKGEYQGGHIKGSINIPVDVLSSNLGKLKKDKTIITCCASGMRSASAKSILQSNGFANVHNGGGWMSLQDKI